MKNLITTGGFALVSDRAVKKMPFAAKKLPLNNSPLHTLSYLWLDLDTGIKQGQRNPPFTLNYLLDLSARLGLI
jgi:hypothetical protein